MSKRNYKKLCVEEFGAHLLTSGDLDPVYVALNGCAFPERIRNRWLTAYCAFYSVGFACYASESPKFWETLMMAAHNKVPTPFNERWPRGAERRHFRGGQAVLAIQSWKQKLGDTPEKMMEEIASGAPSFHRVMETGRTYRSVGNWMGFKLVDLVDACMNGKIEQEDIMLFMYDAPVKSLLNLWREKCKFPPETQPKELNSVIIGMVQHYKEVFKDFALPHKPESHTDMFALETIFCKHGSHLNGHYPLYNDIDEITHGLEKWLPYSDNAKRFHAMMPKHL